MDYSDYLFVVGFVVMCFIVIGGIIVNILGLIVVSRPDMKSRMNLVLMGKFFSNQDQ